MERLKNDKKLRRILAFFLAVILILGSIPVNGLITSRVMADDGDTANSENPSLELSDFVIQVNSILGLADDSTLENVKYETASLEGAEVTITAQITVTSNSQNADNNNNEDSQTPEQNSSQETVTIKGKTGSDGKYTVSKDDLTKLKGEQVTSDGTNRNNETGKVTVSILKDGYKKAEQDVDLNRVGAGEQPINADNPLIIEISSNVFGATISPVDDLSYTGEEQALINPVVIENIEEKEAGQDSSGNKIYTTTEYSVEYSTDNLQYSNEIPKETNAGKYSVYVKITKTTQQYTKTTNSNSSETNSAKVSGTETKNVISSEVNVSVKKEIVSIAKNSDEFTLDFYNDSDEVQNLANGVNISWGEEIAYIAKSDKAPNATINYEIKEVKDNTTSDVSSDEISIDNTGKVVTKKASVGKTYKVIATMTSINDNTYLDSNYELPSIEYIINVQAKSGEDYSFQEPTPSSLTYEDNLKYTNEYKFIGSSTDTDGLTVQSYKIIKQLNANSEDKTDESSVADIESNTGKLAIKSAGTVTVEAVISDEDKAAYGLSTNPSYTLTINRAEAKISFADGTDQTIEYGEIPVIKTPVLDKVDASSSVNNIVYSVGGQGTIFGDSAEIATIDGNKILINGVGTITVTAKLPETDKYKEAIATYTITVEQAVISLEYKNAEETEIYNKDKTVHNQDIIIKDKAGNEIIDETVKNYIKGVIEYSQASDYEIKGFATNAINSLGEVTLPETEGQIKIQASLKVNPFYKCRNTQPASYILKQTVAVQDETQDNTKYFSVKCEKPQENGWYSQAITIKSETGYKIALSNSRDTEFADEVTIDEKNLDTNGQIQLYYLEISTGSIIKSTLQMFNIDTTAPDINIEYVTDTYYTIIGALKNIFYGNTNNQPLTKRVIAVKVSAQDTGSGIKSDSIKAEVNGVALQMKSEGVETKKDDNGNDVYYATFTIPSEQKGNIKYRATNNAGIEKIEEDDINTVVTDDTNPVIKETLDTYLDDKSFSSNPKRTLNIEVTEQNFDNKSDFIITINKKEVLTGDSNEIKIKGDTLKWTKDENNLAIWKTSYDFKEDGIYTVSYAYNDPSRNEAIIDGSSDTISNYKREFVVDTTSPVVNVVIKDNEGNILKNESYTSSKDGIVAEISVKEELGFNADKVDVSIETEKLQGASTVKLHNNKTSQDEDVDISDIQNKLHNNDYWSESNSEYKADIKILNDAIYTVSAEAQDDSDNKSESKSTSKVIYDKTAPTSLKVEMTPEGNKYSDYSGVVFYPKDINKISISLLAEDQVSQVDYFEYYFNEDTSKVYKVNANRDGKYIITINSDFNGIVSYKAYDKAGNVSEVSTTDKIIIDSNLPVLDVTYSGDKNDGAVENHYSNNVTMNIEVKEENYYNNNNDSLSITATYTPYHGKETDISNDIKNRIELKKANDEQNTYKGSCTFTEEGTYYISVKYTDKAGNESEVKAYSFEIDKTAPEILLDIQDENGNKVTDYTTKDVYAVITIQENGAFNKDKANITYSANDVDKTTISVTPELVGDEWAESISQDGKVQYVKKLKFDTEAAYSFAVTYKDDTGFDATKKTANIVYDKTAPKDLSITYSEAFVNQTTDYNYFASNNVAVTLTALDDISGIDYFEYSIDGKTFNKVELKNLTKSDNNKVYTTTIKLPDEYKGNIQFKVTDKANNTSDIESSSVVKDTISPKIDVKYTNNVNLEENKVTYINKDFTANVEITEENFNQDTAVIKIEKTNAKDKVSNPDTTEEIVGDFKLNNGVYSKSISFSEEYTYKLTITEKDYAQHETIYERTFVLDKTQPEVEVDFNGDKSQRVEYPDWYQNNRTATITVTEHNFSKDGMSIVVSEKNGTVDKKATDYYLNQWKNSVKSSGDKHTGTVVFENEAEYEITVVYTDLAGNKNTQATYKNGADDNGELKDSEKFAIDKTNPVMSVEYTQNNKKDPVSGDHYTSNVTTEFKVTEHNFNQSDFSNCFSMTVKYQPYLSDVTTDIKDKVIKSMTFVKDGQQDEWSASYEFNEDGVYTIEVSYIDQSGRKVEIPARTFYIDKTDPGLEINITDVDGKQLSGSIYSQKEIITEIVIDENASFNPANVKLKLDSINNIGNYVKPKMQVFDVTANEWKQLNSLNDLKNYWENNKAKHTVKIKYVSEANYTLKALYVNDSERQTGEMQKIFSYDKTLPYDLSITYDQIEENNQQGYRFFNEDVVTVTLTAKDKTSGVSYFRYSLDNGASWNTLSVDNLNIQDIDNERVYSCNFTIQAQYKDTIVFEAVDKADNKDTKQDSVIIDTIKPVIDVTYINDLQANVYDNYNYYQGMRQAKVIITENNFYNENIYLVVREVLNDGTQRTVAEYNGSGFELVAGTNNQWQTKELINFADDADYTFFISAKDYSNNVCDDRFEAFTVDNTNPDININFNGDLSAIATNVDQFKQNRTATVTISEHNFNANDINITVLENDVDVSEQYKQALLNTLNTIGDIHQGSITFSNEMNYTFAISYIDKSGRYNNDIVYVNGEMSQDLARATSTRFTVDKTAPNVSMTMDGKITDEENRWSHEWDNNTGVDGYYNAPSEGVNFGLWSSETVNINVSDSDNLSGIEKISYYVSSSAVQGTAQLATMADAMWTNFESVQGGQVVLAPNSKSIIYVRVIDRAGNISYLSSNGVIVDNVAPTGDVDAPEVFISTNQASINDIYNSNVTLNIAAHDPMTKDTDGNDFYSGIRSVTYRISANDTGAEETGTLLTGATDEFSNVTQTINSSIVVDGETFNSNEVSVEVTVVDNAGNTNYGVMQLQIDTTNPTILVTYDNNNGDTEVSGGIAYFKEERTAVIDVTERNFDESAIEMTINATDGATPDVSGWQVIPGSQANSDDTIYRATVRYYADSDYTFDIAFTDKAGNVAPEENYEGQAPTEFTIDRTNPVISVSYDNNSATNGNYYNEVRTATITIEEHNFETSRVVPTLTTEGGTAGVPQLSDWSTSGDTHTAIVTYPGDTLYSFELKYTDMAGNQAEDYNTESFYVDVTPPELSIENVESQQAYKDEVIRPVITYSDQYYDAVQITLTGAEHGNMSIDEMGSYSTDENGGSFTFDNITEDDIYTLSATVIDKAGNQTEQSVEFSVNRDGSTYSLDTETEKINGSYIASAQDVIIREVNPDELLEHKLTLFKNDKTITLVEGTDYSVTVSGGNGQWYEYTYTVFAKNFQDDGVYRLTVHSVDKAGNIAENVITGKDKEITFGVDATAPNIIIMNLESNTTYPMDNLEAIMSVSDNLKLDSVEVYLDNQLEKSWGTDEIKSLNNNNEDFSFNINGESTEAHNVSVIAIDAAGNTQKMDINNFYVTTNLWIRFYTNPYMVWGTVGVVAAIAIGAISIVVFRRRKLRNSND